MSRPVPLKYIQGLEKTLSIILEELNLIEEKLLTKYGYRIEQKYYEKITNELYPEMEGIAGKIIDIEDRIYIIYNILVDKRIID